MFEQIARSAWPNLDRLSEQVTAWTTRAAAVRVPTVDIRTINQIGRMVAGAVAADAIPDDVRSDPRWRVAIDEWIDAHALAVLLWLAAGVITVLFCVATAVTPELVEDVNKALATPGLIVSIGFAVWAQRKQ